MTGPEGVARLTQVAGEPPTPALVARLQRDLTAAQASAVLEAAEARRRATRKFERAEVLLLTRRGLEQATDGWVAGYKALRFAALSSVLDIGCGVGGDLMAIAAVTAATACERDPALARFAEHNVRAIGLSAAVRAAEATPADLTDCDAWHADPDRRPAGRRTTRVESGEPSLDVLSAWRDANATAAIKLAPAAEAPKAWRDEAEQEWVSRGGECRQLVVWSGGLARRPGARVATRILVDGKAASFVGNPAAAAPPTATVGDWVFEPDPAVLAAGLRDAIAAEHGLSAFAPVAYLTGEHAVASALLSRFRVLEVMPFDRKRLAGWLAERGVGPLEIKCRGVAIDPPALRRQLKPRGDRPMTLLLAPGQERRGKAVAILADRRTDRVAE